MHLAHVRLTQVAHGFLPVKHGRQLQHDTPRLLQEQITDSQNVGRAVADAVCTSTVIVATGGVYINKVYGLHLSEIVNAVATDHLGVLQA